jgi:predicted nucleotide-binding protein (sugar kinase/HSP70/actin superfamily)
MWENWFGPRLSGAAPKPRSELRVGIPRVLNIWSTHQFWIGFFNSLGITKIIFSSDTSEEQGRSFGRGRGTVDCCYPVKCMSGHYGELIFGQKRRIDILFSPMVHTLPSPLNGQVVDSLSCPRVMAGPENIKAGFSKEKDIFAENGIAYVSPLVGMAHPRIVPKQLFEPLSRVIPGLTLKETTKAVEAGFAALDSFNAEMRQASLDILKDCAAKRSPCIMVLARPYHMDPGIGHEIETDLQAYGYPVLWAQYIPTNADFLDWLFGEDVRAGRIRSPFDIADVWPSSYSGNTNELLWGAKVAARIPWVTCVVRLTSYECGMDQPTYTPVQKIVEGSGTMFFSFQDLDSTKPAGSVKIRVETIAHYLSRRSAGILEAKLAHMLRPPPEGFARPMKRQLVVAEERDGRSPTFLLRSSQDPASSPSDSASSHDRSET